MTCFACCSAKEIAKLCSEIKWVLAAERSWLWWQRDIVRLRFVGRHVVRDKDSSFKEMAN